MSEPTVAAGSLIRTGGGKMIHRADCAIVLRAGVTSSAQPWPWAEGRTLQEIRAAIPALRVRACRLCHPLGHYNTTGAT